MRRVFVRLSEVPGLLWGVLTGDAVALRRVLGARRGGRIGLVLIAAALWVGVNAAAVPMLAVVHLGVSIPGTLRVGALPYQRLVPWALAPLLFIAAPARFAGLELAPLVALIVAHGILWIGLRSEAVTGQK